MKFIIGDGIKGSNRSGVILREADMEEDMRDMTFPMIAEQLAKQYGLNDCIVSFGTLSFSIERPLTEETSNE